MKAYWGSGGILILKRPLSVSNALYGFSSLGRVVCLRSSKVLAYIAVSKFRVMKPENQSNVSSIYALPFE